MNNSPKDQNIFPCMSAEDAIELIRLLEEQGITVIVDGGWGVDALLGRQTRPHEDLDIATLHKDVPLLRQVLEARGFQDVPRDDTWECNFVLGDERGLLLDIHTCTFDTNGKNIFGVAYELGSWQGEGRIKDVKVRCIPVEWLVHFHTGYPLDEKDYHDVKLLCEQFHLPLPADYAPFVEKEKALDQRDPDLLKKH
jgi:lincosamide nucleotidyltransferase A/C/D/E